MNDTPTEDLEHDLKSQKEKREGKETKARLLNKMPPIRTLYPPIDI